jgi:dTDP-4-amino-4,6-dideoxygalactose transaminase
MQNASPEIGPDTAQRGREFANPLSVPFLDLAAQTRSIENDMRRALDRVLQRCDFIAGSEVALFECALARFLHVDHVIGVGNGLDALRLSLTALGIGAGDEVLVPSNTFIATALAVSAVGARVVLVDCDPGTYNLAADCVAAAITTRTRAIVPVHLTGQPADMQPLLELARRKQLQIVEDVAQAAGASYRGTPCGALGTAGCFSFYPSKNLGAFGDGGAISTNDGALAERVRRLRNYGQVTRYDHREKGLNSRLDTLQAAVLNVKLPYLPQWNAARADHAALYRDLLANVGDLRFQRCLDEVVHVYHFFVIETERRDALQRFLAERAIDTRVHYPKPIHLQQAYTELGLPRGSFPNAERLADTSLSLPMYPELRPDQIAIVSNAIRDFFAQDYGQDRGLPRNGVAAGAASRRVR